MTEPELRWLNDQADTKCTQLLQDFGAQTGRDGIDAQIKSAAHWQHAAVDLTIAVAKQWHAFNHPAKRRGSGHGDDPPDDDQRGDPAPPLNSGAVAPQPPPPEDVQASQHDDDDNPPPRAG